MRTARRARERERRNETKRSERGELQEAPGRGRHPPPRDDGAGEETTERTRMAAGHGERKLFQFR